MHRSQRTQSLSSIETSLNILFGTYERYVSPDIFGKLTFAFWEFVKDFCIAPEIDSTAYNDNRGSYDSLFLMSNPY